MWDLPRPGIEPVSPALAGGFLTTAPLREVPCWVFIMKWILNFVKCFCLCWEDHVAFLPCSVDVVSYTRSWVLTRLPPTGPLPVPGLMLSLIRSQSHSYPILPCAISFLFLAAFKIFSSPLAFSNLIVMCIGYHFFLCFILLGNHWNSWICGFTAFKEKKKLGKISTSISKILLPPLLWNLNCVSDHVTLSP